MSASRPPSERIAIDSGEPDQAVIIEQMLPVRRRFLRQLVLPEWASLAASFVLGAFVLDLVFRLYGTSPVIDEDGRLVAAGGLAQALSGELAGTQSPRAQVHVGLTFLARGGDYCRAFRIQQQAALAGLACRDSGEWQVAVLAHVEDPMPAPNGDQSAASAQSTAEALPTAVVSEIDRRIVGAPLDAQAQASARASGWRAEASSK